MFVEVAAKDFEDAKNVGNEFGGELLEEKMRWNREYNLYPHSIQCRSLVTEEGVQEGHFFGSLKEYKKQEARIERDKPEKRGYRSVPTPIGPILVYCKVFLKKEKRSSYVDFAPDSSQLKQLLATYNCVKRKSLPDTVL